MTRKTFSLSRSNCKLSSSLATEPGNVGTTSGGNWTHLKMWVGLAWTFNFGKGGDEWQGLSVCPYTRMSWWHRRNGVNKSGGQWNNRWDLPQASLSTYVPDWCSPEGCSKPQGPQPALTPTNDIFRGWRPQWIHCCWPTGLHFLWAAQWIRQASAINESRRCVDPVSDSQGGQHTP